MPITESLIQLTSAIWRRDFLAEGRTMKQLDLDGLSAGDFRRVIEEGFE
jgi:hypothetical protein